MVKEATASASQAAGIDPSRALSPVEAAELVGVPLEAIESKLADGALLYETQKAKGREVRVIRILDLFDAYPDLRPSASDDRRKASDEEAAPRQAEAGPPAPAAPTDVAEAVRASGADRNALIELCQDLETRLDLAERERQASTASLLMAQRRVLELERSEERRPLRRAAGVALCAVAASLVFLAVRLPAAVREAAAEEVQRGLSANEARLTASWGETFESARSQEQEDREAQLEEIRQLRMGLEQARAVQASELTESRARMQAALENLLSSVERRLEAAEAASSATAEALASEQARSERERQVYEATLRTLMEEQRAQRSGGGAALDTDRAITQPAGETSPTKKRAPWWKRALRE